MSREGIERHREMSFLWTVAFGIFTFLFVRISRWLYRWSNPKCNGKLPPGSMGFPIIGETVDFFKPYGFNEISPFVKKRMLRYGPLFRTNILGSNLIFSTDPEVNFEIFRQENKSFVFSILESSNTVFGKDNLFLEHGNIHRQIKQITLHLLGSDGLKRRIIDDMDKATREHLRSKASEGTYDVKDAVASLIISYMTPKMISDLKPETQKKLMKIYKNFNFDWFKSIFNISTWKALYKVLMARRDAVKVIQDVLKKRKATRGKYGDFVDTMIEELEKDGSIFNDDYAIGLIFLVSVVPQEATSTSISLIMKHLSENPKVLAELKREHETILQNREDKKSGVSWDEYRNKMTFTNMVINESLRLGNTAPVLFRKAVNDVEINGYTIPAGWTVAVAPPVVHCDPQVYENPFEFNPWRWAGKDVRGGSKTFVVFGVGVRQCAGAEFARLQMAIFIHYLVTNYDFSLARECEVIRTPIPNFSNGLCFNISKSPE
ncbi:unnamed protein product [Eruca vesicaria subsp. sativa]|uniref:Cytochrome P450 n=1 Tax=Eruca vesicaria subsp. sativa TaxID=29727 RepID=A0ABC8KSY9_ERUVS|nr:unnamed protein product [Eruca vesicaria subsp. sativa]